MLSILFIGKFYNFKHLFSQINMNVYFKDGDRTIDGSVQKIRIRNVSTQGEYNITFDNNFSNKYEEIWESNLIS